MTHPLRPQPNVTFTALQTCVLLPLVGGCQEPIQDTVDEQPRYGTLDVRIHDAPVDASAVIITPVALSLKQCSGGGFIDIQTEPASLDLLKLVDGELATIVDSAEIPIGKYCEARLVLAPDATLVDGDGVVHDLETPSATTSGYKIKDIEFEIIPGDIRTVLHVDFDVEQSIVEHGNGSFGLKPVLRADSTSYQTLAGGRHRALTSTTRRLPSLRGSRPSSRSVAGRRSPFRRARCWRKPSSSLRAGLPTPRAFEATSFIFRPTIGSLQRRCCPCRMKTSGPRWISGRTTT